MGGCLLLEIDKKIIMGCKNKNKHSFEQLFEFYKKYVYGLCYGYTLNEQDSLDMVQNIFLKVYQNIDKYNQGFPFKPWLRKLSVNTCLNFKRTLKNNIISIDQKFDDNLDIEDTLSSDFSTENEVLSHERKSIIKKLIQNMPDKYRMILTLRYYENLDYEAISKTLNEPLGTVKTRLYRAKKLLKDRMSADWSGVNEL